jgi:hypothetical protein
MRWKGLTCNGVKLGAGIRRWEDMVFRRKRSRNLQTLTADTVLSVKVGVVLKGLLMGTRQIGQSEDSYNSPVIHLPEEDARRSTIAEWKHSQEWDDVVVPERDLLDLQGLSVWTVNPGLCIMRDPMRTWGRTQTTSTYGVEK